MNRYIFTALLLCGAVSLYAPAAFAQDAVSILSAAKNRIETETISSRSRMVITARNGSTRELLIDQFSKDGPNGARTVIEFLHPANVAGTRFLNMDNAAGGTDQWMYLPGLGRAQRIEAAENRGNFMGTDFSFNDISLMDRDVSLDNHSLLREEMLNGRLCYVVQSLPKSSYQYSRTLTWVDKERYIIYKAEMHNSNGAQKIIEMSDFRDIQGHLSPMQTKISTVAAGTSTTIFMEILRYNAPIPDAVFSPAYLER